MEIKAAQAKEGIILRIGDPSLPGGLVILFNAGAKDAGSVCRVIAGENKTLAYHQTAGDAAKFWGIVVNQEILDEMEEKQRLIRVMTD